MTSLFALMTAVGSALKALAGVAVRAETSGLLSSINPIPHSRSYRELDNECGRVDSQSDWQRFSDFDQKYLRVPKGALVEAKGST